MMQNLLKRLIESGGMNFAVERSRDIERENMKTELI
jgi:hypothetical protein